MEKPGEALLLWGKPRSLPRVVDRLDAVEEFLILKDPIGEIGELRRHLAFDFLDGIVGEIAPPDAVDRLHPFEVACGPLERLNRVGKRRRGWVGGNRGDGVELRLHGSFEGGAEIGDTDLVERRHAPVGTGPGAVDRSRFGGRGHRLGEARERRREHEPRDGPETGSAGGLEETLHVPVLRGREGRGGTIIAASGMAAAGGRGWKALAVPHALPVTPRASPR